jgi:hypothetical protein
MKSYLKTGIQKGENLIWLLSLLVAYSILDYYINFLLESADSSWIAHILALTAVVILAYGIFTNRNVRKGGGSK